MLRNTFLFLDRLGRKRERMLWSMGISDWDAFLRQKRLKGVSPQAKLLYDMKIRRAVRALREEDSEFFAAALPVSEHYRLYDEFRDRALFLDIETSAYYRDITVIGMFDGERIMTMVKGYNLSKELLLSTLSRYKLIVTFNGLCFDLPVIERYFGIKIALPHVDLRFVCKRIGLAGGLKRIEGELGIRRDDGVTGITGEDAVYLWEAFRATRNPSYLHKLLRYNEEDVINLVPLADYAVPLLWSLVRADSAFMKKQVAQYERIHKL